MCSIVGRGRTRVVPHEVGPAAYGVLVTDNVPAGRATQTSQTNAPERADDDAPERSDLTRLPGIEAAVVPPGIKVASDWAWRLLLIGTALYVLSLAVRSVSEIVVPVAIAVLLTALLRPVTLSLHRRMPTGAAAGLTVAATILVVGTLITLVGSQFSSGLSDLTQQVATGLDGVRDWVRTTFKITDAQFNSYFDTVRDKVSSSGNLGETAASVGLTATHFLAGLFIALFSLFFFLYEGPRIWTWMVRLFPRDHPSRASTPPASSPGTSSRRSCAPR